MHGYVRNFVSDGDVRRASEQNPRLREAQTRGLAAVGSEVLQVSLSFRLSVLSARHVDGAPPAAGDSDNGPAPQATEFLPSGRWQRATRRSGLLALHRWISADQSSGKVCS